jgi:hypothetical protein
MTNDDNVIIAYTDQQAVEDGVLVAINGTGGVNRVTRAVFDDFTKSCGSSPLTGPVIDITRLMEAIRAMVKIPADEDGWRTGMLQGKKLWLVPNEVSGLTLMFPEDY